MRMSDLIIEQFIERLMVFYGRAFTIVSGRDAYSFEKNTHKNLLDHEGIYLLLENVPLDNMKRKYDKATMIPAYTVNNMIPTNDPNSVKKGYTLSGSRLRMEFYKQCIKLFQTYPVLIREVTFTEPRKTFRLDRKDWEWLTKYGGDLIFICTIQCGAAKRLANIIRIPSKDILFECDQNSKSIVLDLDGIVLKRISDMGYSVTARFGVLTNGQYTDKIASIIQEEQLEQDHLLRKIESLKSNDQAQQVFNEQIFTDVDSKADQRIVPTEAEAAPKKELITVGQKIKVTIPSIDHDFEVYCIVTDFRRIEHG